MLLKKKAAQYKQICANHAADSKTVIFSSFSGRFYSDSPRAVYEYMLSREKYNDYTFIWSFREPDKFSFLLKNKNTAVVADKGDKFEAAMASSKYWVTNSRVPDHIYPSPEQVYFQLWHGTPLKKLGYDIEKSNNAMNTIEEIRDKYKTDAEKFKYILSPSPFASEKFISAWNLKAIKRESTVLELGYPRNDFLSSYAQSDVQRIKKELGLENTNKKIILYAPTWRDNQYVGGTGYTYKIKVDFDILKKALGDEYIILFRAHYLVANSFDFDKYRGFIYNVSAYNDVNRLYAVSDLLVTDYSSVLFDYAVLKKPMIFYMYDMDEYADEIHGFYVSTDELPGSIVKNEDDLIDAVHRCDNFEYDEKYRQFNRKFNPYDDGEASARVTEALFE